MTPTGELRLGLLGMSAGNGHPYSWAAICNGYDPVAMASCPFPAIPAYLRQQNFPDARIPGARVTHVWAQDRSIAQHIAAASLIPTVVDGYTEMIGNVDAILLARDDAENHLLMSAPFLEAGLPVYIDKPIALSIDELDRIYALQRYPSQLFSCSALRYCADFELTARMLAELGEVRHIDAETPGTWQKYGVHLVEPVLNMFDLYGRECEVRSSRLGDVQIVTANWGTLSASFTCLGPRPGTIRIRIPGTAAQRDLTVTDTYMAFKRALNAFIEGVRSGREMIPRAQLYRIVSILEKGMAHGS